MFEGLPYGNWNNYSNRDFLRAIEMILYDSVIKVLKKAILGSAYLSIFVSISISILILLIFMSIVYISISIPIYLYISILVYISICQYTYICFYVDINLISIIIYLHI